MQWGAVERQPQRYDWSGYRQMFEVVKNFGLSIQVVLSFHSCGGNVGDSAQIPLPRWVLKVRHCSAGQAHLAALTPLQVLADAVSHQAGSQIDIKDTL